MFLLWEAFSIANCFPSKSLVQAVFLAHSWVFFEGYSLRWLWWHQSDKVLQISLQVFWDLESGIEEDSWLFSFFTGEKMPYSAFLAFYHSSPFLSLPQMPYPNRFSNTDIISRIILINILHTGFLHSLHHTTGRIRPQSGVKGSRASR